MPGLVCGRPAALATFGMSSVREDPPAGWVRGEVGLQALSGGAPLPWEEQVLLTWQGLCPPPLSLSLSKLPLVCSEWAQGLGPRRLQRVPVAACQELLLRALDLGCPLSPSPAASPLWGHSQWERGGCLGQRPPDRLSPVGTTSGAPSSPDGLRVGTW